MLPFFAMHSQLLYFTYTSTVKEFHSEACHSTRLLELTVRLEHYLQMCALLSPVIICNHGLKREANTRKLFCRYRLKPVTQVALHLFVQKRFVKASVFNSKEGRYMCIYIYKHVFKTYILKSFESLCIVLISANHISV